LSYKDIKSRGFHNKTHIAHTINLIDRKIKIKEIRILLIDGRLIPW